MFPNTKRSNKNPTPSVVLCVLHTPLENVSQHLSHGNILWFMGLEVKEPPSPSLKAMVSYSTILQGRRELLLQASYTFCWPPGFDSLHHGPQWPHSTGSRHSIWKPVGILLVLLFSFWQV